MKERKIISISINLIDDIEIELFEHLSKKSNRSKYLKRLIYDDLKQVRNQITTTVEHFEETLDKDLEAMNGFF